MLRCLVKPSEPHVLIHHRTITKEEINTQEKIYRRIFHNGYLQAYIPKRPRVIWLAVVDLWCFEYATGYLTILFFISTFENHRSNFSRFCRIFKCIHKTFKFNINCLCVV